MTDQHEVWVQGTVITDKHREQVAGWRRLFVLAAMCFVGSLVLNVLQWREDQTQDAVAECRNSLVAEVSDASVGKQIELAQLVVLLAEPELGEEVTLPDFRSAVRELERAVIKLEDANDARQAFEEDPTGDC